METPTKKRPQPPKVPKSADAAAPAAEAPDHRKRWLLSFKYGGGVFLAGLVMLVGGIVWSKSLPAHSLDSTPLFLIMMGVIIGIVGVYFLVGAMRDQGHVDEMVRGKRFVHWRYDPEQWKEFLEAQSKRVALWSMRPKGKVAEAFIGPKGFYLAGDYWPWRSLKIELAAIDYDPVTEPEIRARFKIAGRAIEVSFRYAHETFIPVPIGREKDAAALVKHIRKMLELKEVATK